jgi:hypothetical protein
MDVGDVADVSEVHAAPIFNVYVSNEGEFLCKHILDPGSENNKGRGRGRVGFDDPSESTWTVHWESCTNSPSNY